MENFRNCYTVEPRNNRFAYRGSPLIKVNILRSQMIVFNGISPLLKREPDIKVPIGPIRWGPTVLKMAIA